MSRYTISCHHCGKQATKYSGHVKENLKLGNFSYCSKNCSYKHIKTGKTLTCDNNLCKKSFYRVKNQISDYNFCSRSCAAIINNKIHPKWPPRKCKNHECTRLHNREGSLYCVVWCIRDFCTFSEAIWGVFYCLLSRHRNENRNYNPRSDSLLCRKIFYKDYYRR